MVEIIYDILQDTKKSWKHHKGALVTESGNNITINYDGLNKSAGLLKVINTNPGSLYQIDIDANLIMGDMAFIHCET
jgi:hypothetical protein